MRILPLRQNLLHFAQFLLRLRHQRAVRILLDQLLILVGRALRLGVIAVRLFHFPIVHGRNLQLRL